MKDDKKPAGPTPLDKGKRTRVNITREPKDEADILATNALIDHNTQQDGWHCPRCGVVIKDRDEIVSHLADEINRSMAWLEKHARK